MGLLRRRAVPLVLLLAAACGNAGPGPERVLSAAGGASEEAPPPTAPSTTTAPTTAAPTTTTTKRPAPATTTTPAPTAKPVAAARPRGPYPPGISGITLSATTTSGSTTLSMKLFPSDQYFGEFVQVSLDLSTRDAVRSVKVDFGNGTVVDATPPGLTCPGQVRALHPGAPMYTYPAPGRYAVRAVVTLAPCVPMMATAPPGLPTEAPDPFGADRVVEVSVTFDQAPDRPPRPVGPPPGA